MILIACHKLKKILVLPLALSRCLLHFRAAVVSDTIKPTLEAHFNDFLFTKRESPITNKYLDVINNLVLCNNELEKTHIETSPVLSGKIFSTKSVRKLVSSCVCAALSVFRFKWSAPDALL